MLSYIFTLVFPQSSTRLAVYTILVFCLFPYLNSHIRKLKIPLILSNYINSLNASYDKHSLFMYWKLPYWRKTNLYIIYSWPMIWVGFVYGPAQSVSISQVTSGHDPYPMSSKAACQLLSIGQLSQAHMIGYKQ